MAKKQRISLIHERNNKGQHRIVLWRGEGFGTVQELSPWVEFHEVAVLNRYRATTGNISGLPKGVFMVAGTAHSVLPH